MKDIILFLIAFGISLSSANSYGQSLSGRNDSLARTGPDHLLWYRGKKKNDTTLVTNTGVLVTLSASNNNVEVKLPPTENSFQPLIQEFYKERDRIKEAKELLLKGQDALVNYPVYKALEKGYERVQREYFELTSNTIALPKSDNTLSNKGVAYVLDNCPQREQEYNQIVAYVKENKNKYSFDLPVPPNMDYDNCWGCDSKMRDLYDTLENRYIMEFFKRDSAMKAQAILLMRNFAFMGLNAGELTEMQDNSSESQKEMVVKKIGSKKSPTQCTWIWEAASELPELLNRLTLITLNKAEYLFETYKGDYHKLSAVIRIYLRAKRDYMILTGNTNEDHVLEKINGALVKFLSNYQERMYFNHEYKLFANIEFLFFLARQVSLTENRNNSTTDKYFIEDFLNYNRFKLHFDIDCKTGSEGGYILAHIQGDNYIRIVPDSAHCVKLCLIESGDWGDFSSSKNLNLKLKLLDAAIVAPDPPKYAGTLNWQTIMPDIRFHLCDEGKDTIIVHSILPEGFKETWDMPGMGKVSAGYVQALLIGCFLDESHIEESASELEAHEAEIMADLQKQAANMKAEQGKYRQELAKGKAPSIEQQAKWKQMGEEMLNTSMMDKYAPHRGGNYFFPVNLKNDKIMIEERIDGKKLFPDNEGIIYAYFKIQLSQERKK